jgi:hypothetical protein
VNAPGFRERANSAFDRASVRRRTDDGCEAGLPLSSTFTTTPREISMRTIRATLAAMLIAMACFVQQAGATLFTTNQGDVGPFMKSGWGYLNAQVGSVIFGALYVYDQTRTIIWYTATLNYSGNFVDRRSTTVTGLARCPDGVTYRKWEQ